MPPRKRETAIEKKARLKRIRRVARWVRFKEVVVEGLIELMYITIALIGLAGICVFIYWADRIKKKGL